MIAPITDYRIGCEVELTEAVDGLKAGACVTVAGLDSSDQPVKIRDVNGRVAWLGLAQVKPVGQGATPEDSGQAQAVTGHGYKVGDRVRVVSSDTSDNEPPIGTICEVTDVEPADYDGALPVRVDWDRGWWPYRNQIEPAPAAAREPAPDWRAAAERMCIERGRGWKRLMAKTPREWLLADGWIINEDGDWEAPDNGYVVELADDCVWLYNFETEPDESSPYSTIGSLDARTLRAFADLLDEVAS